MPITARTNSLPDRASPNAATAPSSGINTADNGLDNLCHSELSSAVVGRPAA